MYSYPCIMTNLTNIFVHMYDDGINYIIIIQHEIQLLATRDNSVFDSMTLQLILQNK